MEVLISTFKTNVETVIVCGGGRGAQGEWLIVFFFLKSFKALTLWLKWIVSVRNFAVLHKACSELKVYHLNTNRPPVRHQNRVKMAPQEKRWWWETESSQVYHPRVREEGGSADSRPGAGGRDEALRWRGREMGKWGSAEACLEERVCRVGPLTTNQRSCCCCCFPKLYLTHLTVLA